ncbi:hypothetical protein LLH06_09030 [Mucilaginibacter daejeonensis]|uniref:sensor histidine kinase n=1 Tax=Mucilaginibacter daejeonensis TaxID=398049 RepID=UPI001D17807C|nr:ATP-binding protein [Mucilaginibacter daejeonensis]UEG55104.1 hypothetical protein LLH06_09030 [Mucilaginibacter daejeonensis]
MKKILNHTWPKWLCLMMALSVTVMCYAQTGKGESGIPIQREFMPADYKAGGQNFAIAADQRGVMYFANFSGVLEYDGTTWRTILTTERTKVNTLVTDAHGRVFVGTRGEIGYLKPDQLGTMQFVSLTDKLKQYHIAQPDVMSSYAGKEGIYFITADHIILWDGQKMQVRGIPGSLISAFYPNGKLYMQPKLGGLVQFVNGRYVNIPGGQQFSEQVTVNAMQAVDSEHILIGSGNQGLFMLTSSGVTRLSSTVNVYLSQNLVTCSARLKDGSIAFGTARGGLVVVTAKGELKQIYSKASTGLYDDNIHYLYEDKDHGFWIATEKNITRIEMPSSLSFFNNKKNVYGNVTGITRYKGQIVIATDAGLYTYSPTAMRFVPVPGLRMPCLDILPINDRLLVAASNGVFSYDGQTAQRLMQGYALSLYRSRTNPDHIYVGQLNGVSMLTLTRIIKKLAGITAEVREIQEDENGNMWFGVPSKGLMRYTPDNGKAQLFDQRNGLPYNSGNHLNMVDGKLTVGTIKGAYRFNATNNRFEHAELFKGSQAINNNWLERMVQGNDGTLWVTAGNGTQATGYRQTKQGYEAINTDLAFIQQQQIFSIYPDKTGTSVWLGGADQLILFNNSEHTNGGEVLPALIRSVKVNTDSVLFGGTYFDGNGLPAYKQARSLIPTLDHRNNNISFEFSSASAAGGNIQYRYYLEGFDTDTATWSNATAKEYSNLPAGSYTFKVQARNDAGGKSPVAVYRFSIGQPFYQSIWAYLLYAAALGAVIFVVVKLRSRKLLREKLKLEQLIKERTAEVVVQKEAIENQTRELAGKNNELEKINMIVRSINAEIDLESLLQAILDKAKIIRGAEKAAMLVYDKPTNSFKFKASYGYNTDILDKIHITPEDAQTRYLSAAEEIYEDIYVVRSVKSIRNDEQLASVNRARSSLMMVIRLNNEIRAYMIMENWQKRNAFEERDFSLLKNLKEHFVAAVIKTTLLEDIQDTLANLKDTQEQLIRQEKLASIGQLTKGIVDRILNPLNYINNFSSLSADLVNDSLELINKPELEPADKEEVLDLLETVKGNMKKVYDHGNSASRIVKGMERIMRERSANFVTASLNKIVETSVHQAVAEGTKEFPGMDVELITRYDEQNDQVEVLLNEMNTVLHNLLINAYYAVAERGRQQPGTRPQIVVTTSLTADEAVISIRDNGKGIVAQEQKQLFAPFFTTKPTAKGTGLGLYLSQEIIKEHNGSITVDTEVGNYTEFVVRFPRVRGKHN